MPAPSDDQLLRMIREVEEQEDVVDDVLVEAEAVDQEPRDPCPFCGEPTEALTECHVCGEPGCLPRDSWLPGEADPCLGACVRCARTIHLACAAEDGVGNPRCPTCSY